VIVTPSPVTSRSTVTECSAIGWHSGIRSGVRFAPMMPAILATASASPLGTVLSRSAATACSDSRTRADAAASRTATSLAGTSTSCAWPGSSRWVSGPDGPDPDGPDGLDMEKQYVDHVSRGQGGDLLRNDDQRVGPGQHPELMGRLAGQRRDLGPVGGQD